MGLMNGQAHGFFVMVQRRSADVHKGILIKQRNRSFLIIAWNKNTSLISDSIKRSIYAKVQRVAVKDQLPLR